MKPSKILIVDDDEQIVFAFRHLMRVEGYAGLESFTGEDALVTISKEEPQVVFLDINLPGIDGLTALSRIRDIQPDVPVIIITGETTLDNAIHAMKEGAFDYLVKPLSVPVIRETLRRALQSIKERPVSAPLTEVDTTERYRLIGKSPAMTMVFKMIGSIAATPNHTSVLITGESGTGKELVARTIHRNSSHPSEPFIAINCSAFPETLLESELFGHEKGAFTGAQERKQGKFEAAGQGTIFLDEIGDLGPHLQQKLLRALQEREFERLGSNKILPVQARFIAATHQNIEKLVNAGHFREDLFFRLNVAAIHLPPLRKRENDIELLTTYFLQKYRQKLSKNIKGVSHEAMELLQSFSYPGNVRELENLIERAVMLSHGNVILPDAFEFPGGQKIMERTVLPIISNEFARAREHVLDLFENQFVREQLKKHHGNISAASRECKMSRQNFHRLIEKHRIDITEYKNEHHNI